MRRANYKAKAPAKRAVKKPAIDVDAMPADFDQNSLPSFDGTSSKMLFFRFTIAPVPGKRYYFPQDSLLDTSRITTLKIHFFTTAGAPGQNDMFQTYQDEATNYNTIQFFDYRNVLISLVSKRAGEIIQRMPAATMLNQLGPASSGAGGARITRMHKALDLDISTEKSYIEFTRVPTFTALPFIVPIDLYFEPRN